MDIKIKIDGQIARITNTAEICSGNIKVNGLAFEFSKEWDEFPTKTAVIYVDDYDKKTATNVLIEDNRVDADLLPADLFKKKCVLYVGVIGSNDNEQRITSTVVGQRIKKGTPTDAVQLVDIDIFAQIIAIMNETKNVCDSAIHAVDNNIKYMQRAEEASNQASKSADKAVQAVDGIDASVEKAKVSEQNAKTSENNALATKKSIDEVMADYAYLMELENFRTKIIQVLKEKGITIDDNAKLDDTLIKAIDSISTLQGLNEYVSGDIEEYVNNEIRYVPAYTLTSRANLRKVRMDNLITIGGSSCFYSNSSLKYFKADNLTSLHNSFLNNSIVENLVLPNLITGGYLAISDIPCLRRLVVPKLQTGLNNTNLNSVELCDIGSNDRITDAYLKSVKIFITRKEGTILALPSATKHITNPKEIYVPQDLIEQYKVATNWATYADKFKPLEGSKYEPLNWYEEEAWYKEEMKVWE
jgi:hypothetical protein